MIRSMTGFGSAEGMVGATHVTVELRAVNHRFFTSTIRLPNELARWETEVREALRRRVVRGHVTLSARVDRAAAGQFAIDESRFGAAAALLRGLRDRHGLEGPIDVGTVLRMPEVMSTPSESADTDAAALIALIDRAVEALSKAREEEGHRLALYLAERLIVVDAALDRIGSRAPQRLIEHRDRLRESVRQLTEGVAVDEQRLAMEIAILADRLDVQEELSRFRSHIQAFRNTVATTKGDGVGKRLGFLLQEMLREANTTGSKANDTAILNDVVTIKEELERIREQAENLE
jgi:uncharacterized protein (TIGR00255 family)